MAHKQLSDIRSCYELVGRAQLKIDTAAFAQLPLHEISPLCRQFLYAVLQLNRGKANHALGFIKQAKKRAAKPDELAHVLYTEGLILLVLGETDAAIGRYKICIEMCRQNRRQGAPFRRTIASLLDIHDLGGAGAGQGLRTAGSAHIAQKALRPRDGIEGRAGIVGPQMASSGPKVSAIQPLSSSRTFRYKSMFSSPLDSTRS